MAGTRLPAELHIIQGTTGMRKAKVLPADIRDRVPEADWLEHPEKWNRNKFVKETSAFLWDVYAIGSDQDKHVLAALAAQLDIYVRCWKEIQKYDLVIEYNGGATMGANPYFTLGDKALSRAIVLMGELGLTPRSRLSSNKKEGGKFANLLAGP